ncbi:MAG TPA: T9SS type A sorting domain-containing protein [Phnomibacter sp.]|nr:T9SS type A sorting domain-containing protein [Phnomibacter sp.]
MKKSPYPFSRFITSYSLAIAFLLCQLQGLAQSTADTIQVNIHGGTTYTNAAWNNWNTATTLANSGVLKYKNGVASGISAALSGQTSVVDNGASYGGVMCPPEVLRFGSYSSSGSRNLVLSGLKSNKKYRIEFYASRNSTAGNTTIFTVAGFAPVTVLTDTNRSRKGVISNIQNVSSLTVTMTKGGANNGQYLSGFSIFETSDSVQNPPPDTVPPIPNTAPTANAGADKIIANSATSVLLSGSGIDTDGNIATYVWQEISRTAATASIIATPGQASTVVNNLSVGEYVFRLTVTDNKAASDTDHVTVTVIASLINEPPVVDAGPNTQTTGTSIQLAATASDKEGPVTYQWSALKVPNQPLKRIGVIGSSTSAGYFGGQTSLDSSYVNRLKKYYKQLNVIDTIYNIAQLSRTVYEGMPTGYIPPEGRPEPNPEVNITTMLNKKPNVVIVNFPSNGYSSYSVEEVITALQVIYDTCVGRGVPCFITTTQPREDFSPAEKLRLFALKDSILNRFGNRAINFYDGMTTSDSLKILPEYNFGDKVHYNPLGHERLFQKVVAANIIAATVPASVSFSTPQNANTTISGLVPGNYTFQASVKDLNTLCATDLVQVRVDAPVSIPPVANAGIDQTIRLPQDSITLSGAATDADGTVSGYNWSYVSGPLNAQIVSPNTATTVIRNLVAGVYLFRLTATDNSAATGFDNVQVTVYPRLNTAPIANAGKDTTISLPANSVTLSGTASDADGKISKYNWSYVNGPLNAQIVSPDSARTAITNLVAGVYTFRFSATDDSAAIAVDDVQVTVKSKPNVPPIANAGRDTSITLPVNSIMLSGVAGDADGKISGYNWSYISGPLNAQIVSPDSARTVVNNLTVGNYVFRFRATDDSAATATDDVQVTVNPLPLPSNGDTLQVNLHGGTVYNNSQWNNWNTATALGNSGTLRYKNGTLSGISAGISLQNSVVDNGASYGGTMCPPEVLRFASYYSGATRTLVLNGLSAGKTYKIEFYASRPSSAGNITVFEVPGFSSVSVVTDNNKTNKAVFSGIQNATTFTITMRKAGGNNGQYLSGFTLFESAATPATITKQAPLIAPVKEDASTNASAEINVYPNPVYNRATVSMQALYKGIVEIQLVNAYGGLVKKYRVYKTSATLTETISLQGLPAGIYRLQAQGGNWKAAQTIIKLN